MYRAAEKACMLMSSMHCTLLDLADASGEEGMSRCMQGEIPVAARHSQQGEILVTVRG
jgi:hypothetical protein